MNKCSICGAIPVWDELPEEAIEAGCKLTCGCSCQTIIMGDKIPESWSELQ